MDRYIHVAPLSCSRMIPSRRSATAVRAFALGAHSGRRKVVRRVRCCQRQEWSTPRVRGAIPQWRNCRLTKATGEQRTPAEISSSVSIQRRVQVDSQACPTTVSQVTKAHVSKIRYGHFTHCSVYGHNCTRVTQNKPFLSFIHDLPRRYLLQVLAIMESEEKCELPPKVFCVAMRNITLYFLLCQ